MDGQMGISWHIPKVPEEDCLKRKSTPVYLYEYLLDLIVIWNVAWPSPISPFADLREIVKPPFEKLSHMVGFHEKERGLDPVVIVTVPWNCPDKRH